jgi:hypothetical protein
MEAMPEKRKRSPWRKALWISGAIVVTLTGAAVYLRNYPSSIDHDVAAISAMGFPTTEAEILALEPTDGENADPIYQSYIAELEKLNSTDRDELRELIRSRRTSSLSPSERAKIVAKYRHLLGPIIQGSKKPRWTPEGHHLAPFEYEVARDAFGLLMQAAIGDAEAKDLAGAVDKLRGGQRIYAQITRRPNAIFQAQLADRMWMRALTAIVKNSSDPRTLSEAAHLLETAPPPASFRNNFYQNFYWRISAMKSPVEERSGNIWHTMRSRFWEEPKERRQNNQIVRIYRELFVGLPKDPNDMEGTRSAIQSVIAKHAAEPLLREEEDEDFRFLPSICDMWIEQAAQHRVLLLSVRMMMAKRQSGRYPTSLGSFHGQDAIDPFTGRGLVYKPSAKGFVLYSVGRDRTDDGGEPFTSGPGPFDIVFKYP